MTAWLLIVSRFLSKKIPFHEFLAKSQKGKERKIKEKLNMLLLLYIFVKCLSYSIFRVNDLVKIKNYLGV